MFKANCTPACGTWNISNVAHEIESMVPNGQWFSIVQATIVGTGARRAVVRAAGMFLGAGMTDGENVAARARLWAKAKTKNEGRGADGSRRRLRFSISAPRNG